MRENHIWDEREISRFTYEGRIVRVRGGPDLSVWSRGTPPPTTAGNLPPARLHCSKCRRCLIRLAAAAKRPPAALGSSAVLLLFVCLAPTPPGGGRVVCLECYAVATSSSAVAVATSFSSTGASTSAPASGKSWALMAALASLMDGYRSTFVTCILSSTWASAYW